MCICIYKSTITATAAIIMHSEMQDAGQSAIFFFLHYMLHLYAQLERLCVSRASCVSNYTFVPVKLRRCTYMPTCLASSLAWSGGGVVRVGRATRSSTSTVQHRVKLCFCTRKASKLSTCWRGGVGRGVRVGSEVLEHVGRDQRVQNAPTLLLKMSVFVIFVLVQQVLEQKYRLGGSSVWRTFRRCF